MREALARSNRDDFLREDVDTGSPLLEALHILLHRPAEVLGAVAIGGFTVAILANALMMQTGTHPAPFFARQILPQADPGAAAARAQSEAGSARTSSRPAGDITAALQQGADRLVLDIQTALAGRGFYDGVPDGLLGPHTVAAIRAFQTALHLPVTGEPSDDLLSRLKSAPDSLTAPPSAAVSASPAAPVSDPIASLIRSTPPTPPDRRLLAIEKSLASLGYGPLRADGLPDADTRSAIARFERDRGLPVTGEPSIALMHELMAMSGVGGE